MEEVKWRFPGNHYTADSGLDTADMETFKEGSNSLFGARALPKLDRR
jgi:hypothetical protein